jgi:hypothetical protein
MSILADQKRDRFNQIFCALAVVAAVLACQPFVEAPFDDDWSYSHIALNFARTGRMAYDGWGTPSVLLQAFLGKLLIARFGFSFQLLRFLVLPFGMGCGVLCYRMGRIAGLTPKSSLFASLAFVTSPLFIPFASSFMTDVYACFFTLLSFYWGACAAEGSASTARRISWLSASTAVGFLGGLDRQTVYIAPGAVLLWAIWRGRRDRKMLIAASCLLAGLCVAAYVVLRWQAHQPLGSGEIVTYISSWKRSASYPGGMILTLTLLLLPALVRFGNGIWRIPLRLYAVSALCVIAGFILFWRTTHRILFPWQVNVLTQFGLFQADEEMMGVKSPVMGHEVRVAITAVVLAVLVRITAVSLYRLTLGSRFFFRASPLLWKWFSESPPVLQMSAVFAAVYTVLLIFQARLIVFDRYLLPLMPLALIAILLGNQKLPGKVLTAANWSLLALFAVYGVAIAHDYFAGLQARLTVFERVEATGIPRTQISGGYELDGWTQVDTANRVGYPPDGTDLWEPDPTRTKYWFLYFAPAIQPRYFLSWSDLPRFRDAPLPGTSFATWLPPFRREVKLLVPRTKD